MVVLIKEQSSELREGKGGLYFVWIVLHRHRDGVFSSVVHRALISPALMGIKCPI